MPYTVPLSEQEQAAALWTYVQSKLPRFTSKDALEVVQRVRPHRHEAVKALSTRLRKELAEKGVVVKHASELPPFPWTLA